MIDGQMKARARFEDIHEIVETSQVRVVIAAIPAPIQVALPEDLDWLHGGVEIPFDSYDLDRPQRLARELADEFRFRYLDLRPALKAARHDRPYQARNLHFTELGHVVVAAAIEEDLRLWLADDRALAQRTRPLH